MKYALKYTTVENEHKTLPNNFNAVKIFVMNISSTKNSFVTSLLLLISNMNAK